MIIDSKYKTCLGAVVRVTARVARVAHVAHALHHAVIHTPHTTPPILSIITHTTLRHVWQHASLTVTNPVDLVDHVDHVDLVVHPAVTVGKRRAKKVKGRVAMEEEDAVDLTIVAVDSQFSLE